MNADGKRWIAIAALAFFIAALGWNRWLEKRRAAVIAQHVQQKENLALEIQETELRTAALDAAKAEKEVSASSISDELPTASAKELLAARRQLQEAADYRAGLERRYAPLYRALNLSPEKIQAFENRLVEQWQWQRDLWAAARVQQLKRSDPAVKALDAQRQEQGAAEIRALLGDAEYEELQRYEPARSAAVDAAQRLLFSSEPLTVEQMDRLTQVFMTHRLAPAHREAPGSPEMWHEVRPIVSPGQLSLLQRWREEEDAEWRLSERVKALVDEVRRRSG